MLDIAFIIFIVHFDQRVGIDPSELSDHCVFQYDWFGHVVRRRSMMSEHRTRNSQESGGHSEERGNQHEQLRFHLSPPLMQLGPGVTAVRPYLRCERALGSKPAGSPISFKY